MNDLIPQWQDPFELDPVQQEACDFIVANGGAYIALPVGFGKTCIPLKASRSLPVKTITILCSGNALWTWKRQLLQWRPDLKDSIVVIEKMAKDQRIKVWNSPNIKVIIAKVGTFQRDYKDIRSVAGMVIADECQKYMRKHQSKTAEAVVEFMQAAKVAVFLTGTGVSKGRQEFFAPLKALAPKKFMSYWRFVNQFTYTNRGQFGMEILGPRNTPQFREYTKELIFRPTQAITGLPPVLRQTLPVEMTDVQAAMYERMKADMYMYMSDGSLLVSQNTLAQVTRFRQLLCCPLILDPSCGTYGAGIEMTIDHMLEELEERNHCVWFTPFTAAIPHMAKAIYDNFQTSNIVIFRHGMDMNDLKTAEDTYRRDPKSVSICSIAFSQSFELETGNPAYFNGYSFNPDDNEQGEGRLRRKTTKRECINAYYVQNVGTYDDRNLEILGRKTLNTRVDLNDMHAIRKLFLPEDHH